MPTIQVKPGRQALLSGPWRSQRWALWTIVDHCFVTVQMMNPFATA